MVYAVLSKEGSWRVWLPTERRFMPGEFTTAREAKDATIVYLSRATSTP